jgi:hypothetical protein
MLEQPMKECEGKISSSVLFIIYIKKKYGDSPSITLGQIGDEGDGPTSHPISPSN